MTRLIVLFVFAATFVAPDQARGAATVTRVEVTGIFFDSCANEILDVTSRIDVVANPHTDASGGIHFGPLHMEQHGTATGETTGTRYLFQSVQNSTDNFSDPGEEFTLTGLLHVISHGSASDLLAHTTFHLTITPNGDLTAFVSNISFECRG
jgi:hypothetical protein